MQSVQQQIQQRKLSLVQACEQLVNPQGDVNLLMIDAQLCRRFQRQMRDRSLNLPIIPLLLWQNCYYLGSPIEVATDKLQLLHQRLSADVKIISIAEQSYREWFRQQNLLNDPANAREAISPLTGKTEQEDIAQAAAFSLARSSNQIERIKTLILSALRNRASDIHLEPTESGLQVRYRIDGILQLVTTLPPEYSRKVIASLKVMCEMDIADSRRPQDGRVSEKYTTTQQQEQGVDLRVSTLPCVVGRQGETGEKAVLRLLRQKNTFQTVADLGFSEEPRKIYQSWLNQPQGMIILTGPTGSGKTSTLSTSLQAIANASVNIITIEDPVEYVLPGITQTQVNEAAGMTFAAGLRAILRQDPNIIMIGEIRDAETAETAIRAALTGHLVLTTLHTNDAVGAIPRLKDIGPDPGLISDALLGVVAQRLVRRVCPHCHAPHIPTAQEASILGLTLEETRPQNWQKGRGCDECSGSGYLGRVAVMELLNVDDEMRQIIHEDSTAELHRHLQRSNFFNFRLAAIEKVAHGLTTVEEIRRVLPASALRSKNCQISQALTSISRDLTAAGKLNCL